MRLDVVTLFPDYLAPCDLSLVGRAIERAPSSSGSTTSGTGPTIGIGPSTTPRPAAVPGW